MSGLARSKIWPRLFLSFFLWVLIFPRLVFSTGQVEPRHDPADQLFRFAPVPEAARNVTLRLGSGIFLGFDTEKLRAHSAWQNATFDLYGPPYSLTKEPFVCQFWGELLWKNPTLFPWSMNLGESRGGPAVSGRFRGMEIRGQWVTLKYDLVCGGDGLVRVRETPRWERGSVVRRFEVSAAPYELHYLAHACFGAVLSSNRSAAVLADGGGRELRIQLEGPDSAGLETAIRPVDYYEDLITEAGTEKGWAQRRVQGNRAETYVRLAVHAEPVQFEIRAETEDRTKTARAKSPLPGGIESGTVPPQRPQVIGSESTAFRPENGDDYYRIEHFPVPKELEFLVGGMDWLPNGDLAVCTWLGEVYIVEHAQGPVAQARYRRFARGLVEPLGLRVVDGDIYVVQKSGLLRLRDRDCDGVADDYEVISEAWGFTGNYHSFAFGPAVDAQKNFYVGISGQHGRWDARFQGWCVKISPDGSQAEGFCDGLRVPNGFGTFDGEIFCTDNEGNWIGACKLNHLQRGKFYGFPSSTPAPPHDEKLGRTFEPPAIWFPRNLAPSASEFTVITDDRLGSDFRGQLLVGDFQNASVLRVALEKVNGVWQGAVWMFEKGFLSAVNRLRYGPDGKVYVGGCKRTWSGAGPQEYCLDRIRFTGKVPFEVGQAQARADGFELRFTKPLDLAGAQDADNFQVTQFGYWYRSEYGSPEIDQNGAPNRATEIRVRGAKVDSDGKGLRLILEGLRPGFVTMVRAAGLQSREGEPLWHDTFYYTLNQLPGAGRYEPLIDPHRR